MEGLTPGRMVHFVDGTGRHLAAVVAWVWGDGKCNLAVIQPGSGYPPPENPVVLELAVPFSEAPSPVTWHWIERTESESVQDAETPA